MLPVMKDSSSNVALWATALLVTALWGFNFVVIAVGVQDIPPLLLACLRFVLASVPAVLLIRKPAVPWRLLILYGLFLGVGQFGCLFTAIKWGAPAGLSSVILQSQAFFTALLAVAFLSEKFHWNHAVGLLSAGVGLALLAWTKTPEGGFTIPWPALLLLLLGAFFWAAANIVAKKMGKIDALGLMVWSSLVPPLPLFFLSWTLEGGDAVTFALGHLSLMSWGALAYLAFLSTLLGYGLWNWLIAERGASSVAPFSLLVPLFGVASSWLVLGESLTWTHLGAAALILLGLLVHVLLVPRKKAPTGL